MLGRVAYVVNVFPKLSETFIAWELAELRRRGVKVCILSLRPPDEGRRHEIVREAGLEERVIYDPKEFRAALLEFQPELQQGDRKSTRLNSSHSQISYAVFCLEKKKGSRKTDLPAGRP